MPQIYKWVAETRKGRKLKGEIEAASEQIAQSQLKKRNLTVLKLKPKPKDLFEGIAFMQPKVTNKDIVIFTRQFSTMIDAGLPLVQGLGILAEQADNPTFKNILKQINKDVEGGSTLAEGMKKHPKVFDELFVNLIAAGEVGGILDTILQRLAIFIEKAEELKRKIKGAMTYPLVVIAIAIIVIAVILIFVIPVFEAMFKDFGSALPVPTQLVVNMSNFVKGNIHFLIGAIVVIEKRVALGEFIETGVRLDARVTAELLKTIFQPGTALHDMAVVIRGDRIVAARVQLPLAETVGATSKGLGSRHRAAIGITTGSDAICLVASEETGIVSLAENGKLTRNMEKPELIERLAGEIS